MAMCSCQNCTSDRLGMLTGHDATNCRVYLVICWNCGEIGQWKSTPIEAIASWDRAGGGWEGHKGVVGGRKEVADGD